MGMTGRYIDSLTDEQRDRVIEHPDPTYSGDEWRNADLEDTSFGCACLIGAAEGAPPIGVPEALDEEGYAWWYATRMHPWLRSLTKETENIGYLFPHLTDRFGPERIWAAVKARAAKGNGLPAAPPARETVGAA